MNAEWIARRQFVNDLAADVIGLDQLIKEI